MKICFLFLAALFMFLNCEKKIDQNIDIKNSVAESVISSETSEPIESSSIQTCFIGNTGKDSVFISLDDNLGTITGKLAYKNFEKDSSFGDLVGTKNGDTLKLNYTFQSEGITSDREIFFLNKGGNLLEGTGEHKVENNKDLYVNTSKLKYDGTALKSTDCKDFDKRFLQK